MSSRTMNARLDELFGKIDAQEKKISELGKKISELGDEIVSLKSKNISIESEIGKQLSALKNIENRLNGLEKLSRQNLNITSETNWADIYNSTIEGENWLRSRSFSPGRWAVGYQFLYVLYRILNEVHPKKILDLGLGQSSWMISQYATKDNSVEHVIVEHDPIWIEFFKNDHELSANSSIVRLDWNMADFEGSVVREYGGFSDVFSGKKFDLISIDGPLGGDMPDYARIDVLKMLPDILSDNFMILMDDSQRPGEMHTLEKMKQVLTENRIAFAFSDYTGAKKMTIICSESLRFLTSM